jgi:HK97 family phage major capsid protein
LAIALGKHGTTRHYPTKNLKEKSMKSTSIDSLRQRKVELKDQHDALIGANQAILDKQAAEKRDLTPAEESEFDRNMKALKTLGADQDRNDFMLGEIAAHLERERGTEGKEITPGGGKGTSADGFKSFGEKMLAVHRSAVNGRPDPRLLGGTFDNQGVFRASGGSDGAMNEAVPAEGGFLVGADISEKIYQRTYLTGEITRRCQRQPISANSDRLKLRVVDEDSRADGSRMGGVLAYWQNEADTFLSTRPKFREVELNLNKLTALVYATDELLQDAAALEAWIMSNLPTELAFRTEDAIFQGSGAGQPLGILKTQAFQALSPGSTATVVTTTDVIAMLAQFWYPGLKNLIPAIATENLTAGQNVGQMPAAAWFIDQSVIPQLFQLQLGTGSAVILLYHPPGSNPLYGPYGELMGIPVIPTEHNAALGTVGDIILADMSQYLLADKGAPQVASSMHVRFLQGEMAFRFTVRLDGQTTWKKPLTPKSGGPTLSPFVGLASGASR